MIVWLFPSASHVDNRCENYFLRLVLVLVMYCGLTGYKFLYFFELFWRLPIHSCYFSYLCLSFYFTQLVEKRRFSFFTIKVLLTLKFFMRGRYWFGFHNSRLMKIANSTNVLLLYFMSGNCRDVTLFLWHQLLEPSILPMPGLL